MTCSLPFMLAPPVVLCICNVRQEGRAGSMLLLYIDEAMIYDILGLAVSEKALFYTGSYGRVRTKRNEINQSLLVCWLCVRACAWDLGWRRAWTHAWQEACPHISMSGGPLSSAWYWLVALGTLQVSTSQTGDRRRAGWRKAERRRGGINLGRQGRRMCT